MEPLILMALLGFGVWMWQVGMRAREAALKAARHQCQKMNVQFLDQAVAMQGVKPVRNRRSGWLELEFKFGFEFTLDGEARLQGVILVAGKQVKQIVMEHPEGDVIDS